MFEEDVIDIFCEETGVKLGEICKIKEGFRASSSFNSKTAIFHKEAFAINFLMLSMKKVMGKIKKENINQTTLIDLL